MIEELIEALLGESGTNSLCGRLKVEPWALFFSEKGRLAAEEAARALRLLRAEVKARGYGCTVLKSVWRENSAALPDEYALLAFGAGRGGGASACGRSLCRRGQRGRGGGRRFAAANFCGGRRRRIGGGRAFAWRGARPHGRLCGRTAAAFLFPYQRGLSPPLPAGERRKIESLPFYGRPGGLPVGSIGRLGRLARRVDLAAGRF